MSFDVQRHLRRGFELDEFNCVAAPMENIWRRVRRWAKRNGHEFVSSYGVVDVAPT